MRVTIARIEQQKRNKTRLNLYTEEGFLTSLSYETLLRYGIKEGKEIEEADLEKARHDDTVKYAKEQVVQYVAYAPRSEKQIRQKLAGKGVDEASIDAAVETMERYGYVDDDAYVQAFLRTYSKRLGERAIRQKLQQNGVSQEVIARNVDLSEETQTQTAMRLAEKMLPKYAKLEPQKAKQRMYSALARRGFHSDVIRRVMGKVLVAAEEDWDTDNV